MPLRISRNRVALDGIPLNEGKSADVASASTIDIWAGTGNLVPITGTATISAFATAPQAGAKRTLLCVSTPAFTHGANFLLPGSTDYTATAGDRIEVLAITTTQFRLSILKASVLADVASGSLANANEDFVVLGTKTDGTATADGALYDQAGTALSALKATIVPRTGTLASLLTLAGEVGEIGVATDVDALVRYTGVAGAGKTFFRSFSRAQANVSLTASVAVATETVLVPSTTTADTYGVIDAVNNIVLPPATLGAVDGWDYLTIMGNLEFADNASYDGTFRGIRIQASTTAGGTFYVDAVTPIRMPFITGMAQTMSVAICVPEIGSLYKLRFKVLHDSSVPVVVTGNVSIDWRKYPA